MTTSSPTTPRRRLRVLIISMGGPRQAALQRLFLTSLSPDDFEPPVFVPGVPSRSLRTRRTFLAYAHQAGLLPEAEWQAVQHFDGLHLADALVDVPVTKNRRGSESDVSLHYTVELWRKAKAINRGRSVLACTLAHLMAMKVFVGANHEDDENANEDDDSTASCFDVLMEDNVRWSPQHAAERIRQAAIASREYCTRTGSNTVLLCHLRYLGWLGSRTNLEWMFHSHIPKRHYQRPEQLQDESTETETTTTTVVPFPMTHDIEADLLTKQGEDNASCGADADKLSLSSSPPPPQQDNQKKNKNKPGGTPIWGNYAYWISKDAYHHVLDVLRHDVGALLWKGKRMRYYQVKPVDKMVPRQIVAKWGAQAVHVSTHPAFFRAPMLTSQIHAQWDGLFCDSTKYQLEQTGLSWADLALTETERQIVEHYEAHGEWITVAQLKQHKENGSIGCANK